MKAINALSLGLLCLFASCTGQGKLERTDSGLIPAKFQAELNGKKTDLFVLKNKNNMEVCVTNFGGRIVSILVPDKDGQMRDVVLGFDNLADYIRNPSDFGATIGRYANRINKGKFSIDDKEYSLATNNFGHTLHGGPEGYQYQVFDAKQLNPQSLELSYLDEDGQNGFPGNVSSKVIMTLTDDNAIDIAYEATTDQPTVINMTNHSYFNLNGDAKDGTDHVLTLYADTFTPVDETCMTTGEIVEVENTPLDFRQPTVIGERINNYDCEQVKNVNGYDHNWVLNAAGDINQVCATLYSPTTGIQLDVYTNEPGIQFYSGNFLDGTLAGKRGITYNKRAATCLETQKYPDTPNKPDWPTAQVNPGETYKSHCIYKFSVDKKNDTAMK